MSSIRTHEGRRYLIDVLSDRFGYFWEVVELEEPLSDDPFAERALMDERYDTKREALKAGINHLFTNVRR